MLPRASFDAVLVRKTYHEFGAPEEMLYRIRRALKPDGRLVIVEDIQEGLIDTRRAEQVEHHDLALRYAREELREAGFQIEQEVRRLRYLSLYDVRYWTRVATPATEHALD